MLDKLVELFMSSQIHENVSNKFWSIQPLLNVSDAFWSIQPLLNVSDEVYQHVEQCHWQALLELLIVATRQQRRRISFSSKEEK